MRSSISLAAFLIASDMLGGQSHAAGTLDIDQVCKTAGYQRVELTERNGLFYYECNLKGEKISLLVDSGAPSCIMDNAIIKKLGLKYKDKITYTAFGGVLEGLAVDIDGMMVGPFDSLLVADYFMVIAVDGIRKRLGHDGTLSLQSLQLLGAVIDYSGRAMYLRRPITAAWPKLSGRWVATSWVDDGAPRALDSTSPPAFDFADEKLGLPHEKRARS